MSGLMASVWFRSEYVLTSCWGADIQFWKICECRTAPKSLAGFVFLRLHCTRGTALLHTGLLYIYWAGL